MRKQIIKQNSFKKRAAAGSIIFLLSGLFLIFCCHLPIAQAANQETESCPLAKKHGSCSKTETENDFESASFESDSATDCCKVLPQIFSKARKVEKVQQVAASAEVVKVFAPRILLVGREYRQPKAFQTVTLDRGKTHLKNCVFRI